MCASWIRLAQDANPDFKYCIFEIIFSGHDYDLNDVQYWRCGCLLKKNGKVKCWESHKTDNLMIYAEQP